MPSSRYDQRLRKRMQDPQFREGYEEMDREIHAARPVLVIEVPGRAVSANARLGHNRRTGATYLTQAAREWKETVAQYARVAWLQSYAWVIKPPLRIEIDVRGTRLDADNAAKLVLDGLAAGISIDDREYKSVTVTTTAKGLKEPGVTIRVYEMAAEEAVA